MERERLRQAWTSPDLRQNTSHQLATLCSTLSEVMHTYSWATSKNKLMPKKIETRQLTFRPKILVSTFTENNGERLVPEDLCETVQQVWAVFRQESYHRCDLVEHTSSTFCRCFHTLIYNRTAVKH